MTVLYDDVLSSAKSRALFPSSQITLTDDNLLSYLEAIVRLELTSLIDEVNQEFFVRDTVVPLVASTSEYRIPYRALGRTLREIKFYDSSANRYQDMAMIKLEDAYGNITNGGNFGSQFASFFLKGDKIVLVPDVPASVPSGYSLKLWYKLIPSYPCTFNNAMQVASVSSPNVVVNQIPTNISIGTQVDFIEGQAGCELYSFDKTITNINGTTLTFLAADIPTDLQAGDYISLRQTSPVVNMIPDEAQGYLANKLAMLILYSVGDEVGANAIKADVTLQEKQLLKIIAPRVDGKPQIIISRHNLTRGGRNWQNWYYGTVGG